MLMRWYWDLTGGNILAIPAEALITAAAGGLFALVFRKPLARLAARARRAIQALHAARADAAEARASAAAAHQIAADLYQHHTGRAHPRAPDPPSNLKEG